MNREAFIGLEGCKLSVATTKLKADGTPESYIGFLEEVGGNFIRLDYGGASHVKSNTISKVLLSIETVVGVWVYQ